MGRLFKRGNVWFTRVPKRGGGTRKVSTGCTDKKAAEHRAGELEREAVNPAHAAANKASTADACDEFIGSRVRRGRAAGTLHHYGVKLGHIARLMPERLADVDAAACERFIEARLEEGAAQTTVKKEIRALGATLRHARRRGVYMKDVEAVIPELEETYTPRTRALTPWELVALVNALSPDRAAHVVFIVATGARWSESVRARLDVDVSAHMVRLRGTKTARALRTVPVAPTMRSALAWAVANAPGSSFDQWTNVRRDLGLACDEAGIARVTPNDLRRTFATWLRMSGVTPDIIGAALGHTTSRMAELVYGRIGPDDLDRLISERGPALQISEASEDACTLHCGTIVGHDVGQMGHIWGSDETPADPKSPYFSVPRDGIEPPTRGFSIPQETLKTPVNVPVLVGQGDANGTAFRARARRWLMRVAA